jgi:hypothetical protein
MIGPTVWLLGRGIVAGRIARMLYDRRVESLDPRRPDMHAVASGDVVVLGHGGEHAHPAAAALERGAHVVGIGDGVDDTRAQMALAVFAREAGLSLVVGASMAPGLSGLIARHLAGPLAVVDEIHVAVHGTAGPACARAHHTSLRRPALGWHDGRWVEHVGGSGRELCWFPEPIGARDCYRADHAAPVLLQRAFSDVDRISMRRSATRRDRLTARLPMLRAPHQEGGIGALRVEVRGGAADGSRACVVAGVAERVGTAAGACAAAFTAHLLADGLPTGLIVPGAADLPTLALLNRVETYGVRLQEFTGIPTPS